MNTSKEQPVFITRPAYVNLPKSGDRCVVTGLPRNAMVNLVTPNASNRYRPPVKSIAIRSDSGRVTMRLVNVESLLEYLGSMEEGGELAT